MDMTIGKRMLLTGVIVTGGPLTPAGLEAYTNFVNQKSPGNYQCLN